MSSTTRRPRSRIAHFKTPFIVGVTTSAAAFGAGCGGKAEVLDPGNTSLETEHTPESDCDGPAPTSRGPCGVTATCQGGEWVFPAFGCNPQRWVDVCPSEQPEVGTSCVQLGFQPGLECEYPFCYDATAPTVRCGVNSGVWEALPVPTCNPPAVDTCPPEMPVAGSDCSAAGQVCGYPGCEGPESSTATCTFGQWLVVYSIGPACNPPAVVPVCPETQPQTDAGCAYDGQTCRYGVCSDPLDPALALTCIAGTWQQFEPPCLPSSIDAGPPGAG